LSGSVVAITGGARGIGAATAEALLGQGALVAIGDIDAEEALSTAARLGRGTVALGLDVTDSGSFSSFLDGVQERLGPLDVLINNAGIMPIGPFVEETDEMAHRLLDINLHGVINGSKLALERFIPRGRGHLVNVASTAGKVGFSGGATYCATKHGVVGLSEAIRQEVRGSQISVSIVMPIVVRTELGSGLPDTRGFKAVAPSVVADAIVDALLTGRVDVFVPREVGPLVRAQAVFPRSVTDAITRLLRADRVLSRPDPAARAAYDARLAATAPGAQESEIGV
jgi:NAD(P)-dependent dehydrogenase (short-subunit alcohol dehydrogenase family)